MVQFPVWQKWAQAKPNQTSPALFAISHGTVEYAHGIDGMQDHGTVVMLDQAGPWAIIEANGTVAMHDQPGPWTIIEAHGTAVMLDQLGPWAIIEPHVTDDMLDQLGPWFILGAHGTVAM